MKGGCEVLRGISTTKSKFEGHGTNWVTGVGMRGLLMRAWRGDSPNSAVCQEITRQ